MGKRDLQDKLLERDTEYGASLHDDDGSGSEDEEPRAMTVQGKVLVLVLFTILTLIATFEKVALKKATDSLSLYQVFLNQLIVLLFVIVFLGVVVYKLKVRAPLLTPPPTLLTPACGACCGCGAVAGGTQSTSDISPEMLAFPKWKFMLISMCDTFAGLLIIIPARKVSGDLLTLLIQGTVPATLFFSVVILKKRWAGDAVRARARAATHSPLCCSFHWLHYTGCFVILVGIFLNTWPYIHNEDTGVDIWYTLPLFLSCFPAALSGICAEIALQGAVRPPFVGLVCVELALIHVSACSDTRVCLQDMDIYYYQLWVAISQFFLSAALSPLSFLLQSPGRSISDLPTNFFDGLTCWCVGSSGFQWCCLLGCNTTCAWRVCRLPGVSHPSEAFAADGSDPCDDGFSSVAIYLGLCIVFNIFISLVVKHGGAVRGLKTPPLRCCATDRGLHEQVTMMVALTMAVPLQYLVFSIRTPYFNPVTTPLHALNFVGLAITLVGLVGYHWAKEPAPQEEVATERDANGAWPCLRGGVRYVLA